MATRIVQRCVDFQTYLSPNVTPSASYSGTPPASLMLPVSELKRLVSYLFSVLTVMVVNIIATLYPIQNLNMLNYKK